MDFCHYMYYYMLTIFFNTLIIIIENLVFGSLLHFNVTHVTVKRRRERQKMGWEI